MDQIEFVIAARHALKIFSDKKYLRLFPNKFQVIIILAEPNRRLEIKQTIFPEKDGVITDIAAIAAHMAETAPVGDVKLKRLPNFTSAYSYNTYEPKAKDNGEKVVIAVGNLETHLADQAHGVIFSILEQSNIIKP